VCQTPHSQNYIVAFPLQQIGKLRTRPCPRSQPRRGAGSSLAAGSLYFLTSPRTLDKSLSRRLLGHPGRPPSIWLCLDANLTRTMHTSLTEQTDRSPVMRGNKASGLAAPTRPSRQQRRLGLGAATLANAHALLLRAPTHPVGLLLQARRVSAGP
jgi:hypothetical protein